jgi:serine/threonine-protein kinase
VDADTTPKPPESRTDLVAPTSSSAPSGFGLPRPGDTIAGKYLLREVIGEGGMGVVYEGVHLTLNQPVAIKLLLPEIAHRTEVIGRFLREARAAAQIRCDHAVRIFDVDKTESGAPYLVMERLVGSTLDSVLARQGKLSVEDTIDFVLQACEAVAEAHAVGIVHRDLKPQNLFVTRTADGAALLKVLDFGISKTLDAAPESSILTGPNVALGSPEYMSPEQVRHASQVDERTDIWSIGVILYELLSGKLPFEGDSVPHLFVVISTEAPRPLRELVPEIPDALGVLVEACLAKEPTGRPRDIATLALALAPFGRGDAPSLADRVLRAAGQTPSIRVEPPASAHDGSRRAHAATLAATMIAPPTEPVRVGKKRTRAIWIGAAIVVASIAFAATERSRDRPLAPTSSAATIGSANAVRDVATSASASASAIAVEAPDADSISPAPIASVPSAVSAAPRSASAATPRSPRAVESALSKPDPAARVTPGELQNIDEMKPLP